jgi:hypothetical protein
MILSVASPAMSFGLRERHNRDKLSPLEVASWPTTVLVQPR